MRKNHTQKEMKRLQLIICLLFAICASLTAAPASHPNDSIVADIKNDIKLLKEEMKITRQKQKEEERELRALNRELEKARTQIQRDKEAMKRAKKTGKEYIPNRL